MLSSSLEDCLVSIYEMALQEHELKSSEIAKRLNVPLSRAIQGIQRLHYQKYLTYSPYRPLELTEKGKMMGEYLVARKAIIREFLDILQIEENVESEVKAMEQYLSISSIRTIEKFVLFIRQYPEVTQRYKLFSRKKGKEILLPPLPEEKS